MIPANGLGAPQTARRADQIYMTARAGIDGRLWRAALGTTAAPASAGPVQDTARPSMGLDTLLGLIARPEASPAATTSAMAKPPAKPISLPGQFATTIAAAAERTGIPAAALSAIVDAEAAKDRHGNWLPDSRNPRSTASGLGQFLNGTWKSEAERAGTWLNGVARENGWTGRDGRILPKAQSALLALRHDAGASIEATADYARHSLNKLQAAGVVIGNSAGEVARAAYLGHNLGVSDAIRFLGAGLDDGRARTLLKAQVGSLAATARIADSGSATAAHRGWLLDFIARRVRPDRFGG